MSTGEIEHTSTSADRDELLRRWLSGGVRGRRRTMGRADRSAPLPLSHGQRQMWFLNRLDPGSAEYLVPLAFRLRGPLDVTALERAWEHVVARHEVLRTRYAVNGTEPVQVIDPPAPVALPVTRVSDVDEAVGEEAVAPFDLEHDWPVRAKLWRTGPEDHVLTLVFHHVAFDAWSTRVVGEELEALYTAFTRGEPAPLPPVPTQYADYAVWQREDPALEQQLAYWHGQLAGIEVADLPADLPRPAVRDAAGDAVEFAVPAEVAGRIRAVAKEYGTTPFVVLLTAFQVLMARYTGRSDVPVGTTVSGRTRPELQGMIGYGVNNLVLRARWEGDPSFRDLLVQARGTLADAYDHQAVPFARLVDDLQPERDMSRTPLYQVAFTMHDRGGAPFGLPGVTVEPRTATGRVAKCDLELQINDLPDASFAGQLVYATSVFHEETVQRAAGHLVRLLESALADTALPVSRLNILDDAEYALVTGVVPGLGSPVTDCVHTLFEEQAARTPNAVAIVAGCTRLTYAELNARANRLAHHLRDLGAGPETLVGVRLERGPDLLPALLGVLKSGAGYLPLDPVNPEDRLRYVQADADVSVVVDEELLAALPDGPDTNPVNRSAPDNVVYTIYTSGSTGKPKGCVLTHANVVRLMRTAQEHYEFNESDVWSMFHSYAFDVSVFEMWGALLHGGTLVVVPREVTRSPEDFLDLLVDNEVTVLSQTPSAFRSLVSAAADGDSRIDRLVLRAVIFAGEKLEMPELRPWTDRRGLDEPVLANMYGITETTVHTTFYEVRPGDLELSAGNPIGRPLGDLNVYLLDAHGGLVPVGVPGEIHVGGPGVARGYLNRPELTAERFVPNPFGPPGSRLYRSGDLARRRPDGSLDFLGRADHQVKIRGYRIELGEVEVALTALDDVRDAVVIARDERLVAYVVPVAGELDTASVRTALGRDLPDYMVPAAFVRLDSIPLTPNGKLDRRALPAPDLGAFAHGEYVAPRTPVEEQVAAVWATALEVERVGVHDGFFDLGGDSIRAVALVGALRAEGFDLAVRDVFERRTVAELCELLTGRTALVAADDALVEPFALISAQDRAALPDGVVDAYPLSQIQTGMVIEMLADDSKNNYHNCSCFRILDDRPFSWEAFERAARIVVERHDMLRTSVHLTDYSVPLQLVHATATMEVDQRDLGHLDEEGQLATLREWVREQRATPFDLTEPTLMRFHAHLTGTDRWWISITECHPVMEGWSYHSLLMELLRLYRSIRDGVEPEPHDRPGVRFADSVAAELESLESGVDGAYWRSVVTRYPKVTLPAGWGEEPGTTHHVRVSWEDLEPGLRALAADAGASLKAVMLSAYLKVMSQLTDLPSFHGGLVYDVRPEVLGADRVFGMYLNTLPLPFDRGAPSWLDLVRQVFAQEVESWEHRRYPLPAVQREYGAAQLIDVFFNYQDFRQVDTGLVDASVGIDDSPTEFPLTISSRNKHIFLTAASSSLSLANTERIAAMFRAVLADMAADPARDAQKTFVAPEETARTLGEWAVNPAPAVEKCTYELFEDQVARTPDAVAVTDGTRQLSYVELDALANRYAHRLRGMGVGTESVVGVLLDRGPDLLACLLGVWKASAAYLPMDPSFPAGRVTGALADAEAAAFVTQPGYTNDFAGPTLLVGVDDVSAEPATAPERVADLDRLAYVIYTSGSTGRPKGVQVPHRGLVNHVWWAVQELASQGTGGAPLFSSIAFDLVVPNLWAPVLAGQAVHMVPQDTDLAALGEALSGPYSFIKLTPAHLEVLTHQLPPEQANALASVLVVAGEALTRRVVTAWRELAPDVRLVNEYGPTETSVGTCTHPVEGPITAEVQPIGRPLPNVTMYVLDHRLEPVPVGVPGELYVGGTGVARGYADRPELTAERFLPDPYGSPGARLYRSGDVVRVLPTGDVDFLGRGDGQVKIRGYRVELGEIEARIAEDPRVTDVRVVLREDNPGEKQLVAYLVGADADPQELRALLEPVLPTYMVPSAFVQLDAIPLNANGKVDRAALPAPGADAFARAVSVAPRTPLEERVAAVWHDVLGADFGVHDDFFDLGGDSIRAVALIGALRASGFDVSVKDVFGHRTVAALCERLSGRAAVSEETFVEPFALISAEDRAALPDGVVDAYPLSQVQTGMLVEMLADPGRSNYHNVNVYTVHDDRPFDVLAFARAVRIVVARHDVLRTSVHLTGFSVPLQLVHWVTETPIGRFDLRHLDVRDRRAAVSDFVAAERADVFDLAAGTPLLRVSAHLMTDDEWLCSFTQNHAVMDGWSNQLFLMEFVEVYRRVRDGQEPDRYEPVPVRYADFVAAELRSLESREDAGYWQRLVDEHAKFEIPAGWHGDRTAPVAPVRAGTDFGDLADGLRALASAAKVSMKSVLVAAHVKVMSQLTGETAFHTGLVTHSRPEAPGADRLYGNFLNTLPFPADRSARTWRELVRQVSDREIEAWAHRHYPMPAIRGHGGRLVDVFFGFLDFHRLDARVAEDGWGFNDAPNEFALAITTLGGLLAITTNSHVLSQDNADRVAGMFRAVLASMAAEVDGDARAVYLPEGERDRLLELGGTSPVPVVKCVHELFEDQVARTPDAVAVVAGEVSLTYAELNARANRWAHHLRSLGAGPEQLVGVSLDRGPGLLPALLGVLKSGAGYLPLDPVNPPERLEHIREDAGVSIVITSPEVPEGPETNPVTMSGPDNVIYTIYTSGSTGKPKGCVLTHRNVVRLMATAQEHYAFDESDVFSLFHSYAFDVSVFEMWGALLHGGTLVVVPREVTRSPEDFLDLVVDTGVTVLSQTPSAFRSIDPEDPRTGRWSVRTVVFAGEKLEIGELRPWLDRVALVNMYGITETTVHTTYHRVAAADLAGGNAIGSPLRDLSVHLLDPHGQLVPFGVPGEIHVGGPGVARGYLNRPELTAERFVPDPFGPPGSRLYRSGDLARRRPDGSLDFLGRADHQVKIRGYRVELGEIEVALSSLPGVREAVVVVRDDRLVAYVVGADGTDLRPALARNLPDYMVPSAFVPLDAIPLTANGKLDRRALPDPDAGAFAGTGHVAPRTPVEERIAAVWRDVLKLDRVGVHDGFFEVGGDSIRAVRLVGALRAGGVDLSVPEVFEHRTIAGLASIASGRADVTARGPVEPFELVSAADRAKVPAGAADAYPMSQVQTGMVVELLTEDDAYRSFASYRIAGPFSADALRAAARIVVARHDLLRTSFDLYTYSVPMQVVHAEVDVPVTVHEVHGEDALMESLLAQRNATFDLDSAPLLKIAAHLTGDDGWWLSLCRPHAIVEGWSHNWLLAELVDCYRRLRDGLAPAPHTPPGVRYADYIAAELASLESEEDAAYWRDVVHAHTPVTLPEPWRGEEPGESYDVPVALDEQALTAVAAELRVSVKTVLLAAHVKVMGQLTGAPAFHVGLVCDARPELEGADRVYGMHLNTVPFPADRSATTWRELVLRVFDREVELWPHRRYPMPAIQRAWPGGRLVDVAFNYVDLRHEESAGEDVESRYAVSQTEFGLTLHCRPNRLNLTANTAVLSRADGARLGEMYAAVLDAMTADLDGDARTTHLPTGERARLLIEASATEREPVDLCVQQEFERRVALAPDAIALTSDDYAATYADLNARVNRLAHHLTGLGVGPETVVAICLERSPELVTAVLAVLKAGGAYLPLDPETPPARLEFMHSDAGARLLVTRSSLLDRVSHETVVLVDEPALQDLPDTDPAPRATQDNLAYVIYTSGSTGRPKGVMVRRGGMGNHLLAKVEDLGLTERDSVVQNASPSFDISVWQMLAPLVVGGEVRVVDGDTALDPDALFGLVAQERITVLEVVPSLLRTALDSTSADGTGLPPLPHLRWLMVTGEALPAELCPRWFTRYPRIPLVNAYGPTECSDDVTHAFLTERLHGRRVPIGEAVRNTRLYVLDARLEPVPSGVAGELYVGGLGVGRGYLNRPDLTAEKFVPDPFGPAGARLYRTGDLASWRPDGALDFLGRIDDQVKVRGHRIELGEIEAELSAFDEVREALVVVRDDRLVAYYTGGSPAREELRDRLARTLPDYMVPAAFVRLDEFPLTPNGKHDRKALPEPGDDAFARGEHLAPRTETEARVAEIWRTALGLDRVGVRDGFFDIGGDSIRAVGLVGALRAEGFDVAVRDVFEARTVENLCRLFTGRGVAAEQEYVEPFALVSAEDRALLPADVVDAYPVGRTQLGMIIEMLADDGRHPYHIINTFRVTEPEPLDHAALTAAARVLADRHEVLRTSFRLTGFSEPLQLVHGSADLPVELRDVRELSEEDLVGVRQELAAEQRAAVFDVARAPLMRIIAHVEADDAWWVTFTQSHAITEGWSYHLLLMELLDVYRAIRDGAEPEPYDRPRVRFADTIAGELAALGSAADRAYWQRVTGTQAPVVMPPEWAGDSDERVYVEVPFDDLGAALRSAASAAGVSMKSVLLAAHLKVMGQVTYEPAYHTGLVCDVRPEVLGADRVPGMYLNTLPMGVDRSARTWRELLTQVFDAEVELWAHRRYPMPAVQHDWGGGRLINVLFNYLDFHHVDTDRVATGTRMNIGPNEFDLSIFNRGDRLWVNSHERVLSRANTERLAGMYRAVLEAIASDVDGDARAVHLPAGERERLLGFTDAVAEPVSSCVHELFEQQAARTPDALAVVAGGVSLTYAELNARANRLAHHLRSLGAGPEQLVGVCLDRGPDLLPALLGVLKSGAGYLPLDPVNPPERLEYVREDAGVSIVVDAEVLAALPEGPDANPVSLTVPDNLIYTIYTSGSTGKPKGVCLTHSNVVRLMATAQEHYAFDESDVFSLFHSYAFDVSVFEMWGALLHGGTLVVVPREVTRSPEDFLDLLVDTGVTVLSQTPSAFRSIVAFADDPRITRLSVRAVVFAGEKLEIGELRPWVERVGLGRVALVNMYGITETTVHTTYHRLSKKDTLPGAGNPIGRPLSDLAVHLLDAHGNLVPIGTRGEIHVGGPGVARGYLNRPELTAERFVPDPFGPPGSRLYRSGDLALRRPDGSLGFAGRADDQVKIRGYRVELGEIEAALVAHPDVRDAVVVLRDESLVGYVVPAGDPAGLDAAADPAGPNPTGLDPADLRAWLGRTLPDYMVPAAYPVLDRIPLTPNGKLDKRALPAPDRGAFAGAEFVAPRTPVEERVVAIWRAVLGVDRVGLADSFFDLGGDSIRAVMVVGEMKAAGIAATALDVLRHQTIAAVLALSSHDAGAEPVEPFALLSDADRSLLPDGLVDAYPLTQPQTGMLVEMLAGDGPRSYHRVASARITEPFSRDALHRALHLLVSRHEALRTSVDLDRCSVPVQLVHASAEVPLKVVDLTTAADADEQVRAALRGEAETAIPHSAAPLLRLTVHRLAGGQWQLTITQSHVVIDGWTFSTLRAELLETYRAVRDGADLPAFTPSRLRFADTVAAELRALRSTEDRAYWQDVVDGFEPFALPDGWGGSGEDSHLRVPLDDLSEGLRAVAAAAGVPVKSVLLAAHLKVLSQLTPARRFHSGLVTHCRPDGGDRVYGTHLNTVPFPVEVTSSWTDLARQVFDRELGMWPHRHFPMPAIQHELAGGGRLVQVYFSYEDFGTPDVAADPAEGFSHDEFPLAVTASDTCLFLACDGAVLSRANAERLAQMYRAALASVVAGEDCGTYLPEGEPVLPVGPEPAVSRPAPDMFESHVRATPDAPAVTFEGATVSYAELDARANRVAHLLRAKGVGTESLVGVLLDRGVDLVAALLGVWKAGAAYVPVDPSFPAARAEEMLRGCAAVLDAPALDGLDAFPATTPDRATDPGHLAYVIYTSGSTGRPKGVQVTHGGLANFLAYVRAEYVRDRGAPLFASIAYDMVVSNVHGPLTAGAPLHLAPRDLPLDELGDWLVRQGPFDFVELTRSHLELVTGQVPGVLARDLVVGGEAVSGHVVASARGLVTGRIVNSYGPTETTVTSNEFVVPDGADAVPIGTPLPGVSTYVLDSALRPVPVGVPGELYVGGAGVARGYRDEPAMTADRFVPDPFGAPGSRLYRTGDLARVLPSGDVDFLGRDDGQVKIRGFRVELGEIESVLRERLDDARVVVDSGRLVAYVVGERDDLRPWLASRLPAHLVPAAFVPVPEIPLTANGKLDLRALPALDGSAFAQRSYQEPITDTEQWLADVWAEVLGLERVGAADRFFELGGHSILVFQVIAAARRAGRALSLLAMYADDRLSAVAAAIDQARPAPVEHSVADVSVTDVSVAVIRGGELAEARTRGAVSADTVFQVGSLSKPVTAFTALRLVQQGVLDLDADVNTHLTSWSVPADGRVTLRQLLSHLSGLAPAPNPGYAELPGLAELLRDVRLETPPGAVFRKADVNYTVVEQLLEDVTGRPFAELVRELVFAPLGMARSGYGPATGPAAQGHDQDGKPVPWLLWPAAASGLWTTAGDLASFLLEVRRSRLGHAGALLSPELAGEMVTPQHRHSAYGLGVVVDDLGTDVQFGHGGTGGGFHAMAMCRIGQGTGFVALTGSDAGADVVKQYTSLLEGDR
ncbi:amino acid adenylation domain-containing protein [Lentzea chajnantorensis]